MRKLFLCSLLFVCAVPLSATNVTIGSSGRVTLELIGSDAAFRNTLSVAAPGVAVAITGCKLEPATGLGGVHVLSENNSQRGCRVDLDSDSGTPGIQGFAAGTVFELRMCAQTDSDAQCEYVWSSNPSSNSDGFDHVQTNAIVSGQAFRLNWEDLPDGGDEDFNDLIAVIRVASDADGDGLWDDWETSGIDTDGNGTIDLDLPSLGANPNHKNLFVEIDWMDCTVAGSDCAGGDTHNHRPLNAAVNAVVAAFANAPVANPDLVNGITLRVDVGNSIPHQNAMNIPGLCFNGGAGIGNFDTIKADPANFGPNNPRRFAYRYGIFSHRQVANSTVSGCGELPGNDFQVSFGGWNYWCQGGVNNGNRCNVAGDCTGGICGGDFDGDGNADHDTGTVQQQAGTLMHEFGHTLNLQHGGNDGVNRKPNYLSVMSYAFQMPGIPPTDPDGAGNPLTGRVDFSGAVLAALNETNLNEPAGIGDGTDNTVYFCPNLGGGAGPGTGAINWNCDADSTDANVNNDINGDRVCISRGANGVLDTVAAGDDVVNGTQIWDGPNRTCDTAAAGDDGQVRAVGNAQANPLNGFNDWASILYEFQSTLAYEDGDHTSFFLDDQEIDFTEFVETVAPDVSVTMSVSPDPVITGQNVTYTITLRNLRPSASGSVVVTDVLPSELTFVSCSASAGGICGGSGNNRTITFASIPGGETATVTLVASANCTLPNGTSISNTTSLETSPDADASNNAASVSSAASNPAPVISSISVDRPELWPANHKMLDVNVSYTVTDNCPNVSRSLTVTSNEPVNGTGDGDMSPDWEVIDANRVRLRAERAGNGSGRTYTILITATDSGGATSTATIAVTVPRNR